MTSHDWIKDWYALTYALRHGRPWILAALLVLISISLSFAWVQITDQDGRGLHWAEQRATLNLRLGCPPNGALSEYGPCWDDAAEDAAAHWNAASAQFAFHVLSPSRAAAPSCRSGQIDFLNTVLWAHTDCGMSFGDMIAVTNYWSRSSTGEFVDTDVLFNFDTPYGTYSGPHGSVVVDFHRVAIHEFGHVLGLAHPDDHGQRVTAIMNNYVSDVERLQPDDIAGIRAIYGTQTTGGGRSPTRGVLGNPGHQTFKSGIGIISGWVCDATRVEVLINGRLRLEAAYGTERLDTRGVCGDTNNGFGILFNYNRLGDGVHTARLLADGRQLGDPAEFKVTTFGQEFLRGATGEYRLQGFPRPGNEIELGWDQGIQNFTILERR